MASPASPSLHSHTVLVVEDDSAIRDLLADVLHDEGYVVESVDDGAEALQRLDIPASPTPQYCVVVLDNVLPTVSGLDVLQQLQQRGATPPVIWVSARAEQFAAAIEAGAAVAVIKPFDIDLLAGAVRDLVVAHCPPPPR
jgi:DNA-binding response OmpR family regulator